ncbi:MAG TPA: MerR family transcriptional regulator [Flavobacteriales bacterium]|nr:MerR family transcriptional regulator [Flavobacteriales bacterium]
MPYKSKPTQKLYYSIGEVADMFGVNTSLIRFWENEFDILKPSKTKKGNRMFTAQDIENIKIIFKLVKGEGYTLQGAKEKLKMQQMEAEENKKDGNSLGGSTKISPQTNAELIQKLNHIKKWLDFLEGEI